MIYKEPKIQCLHPLKNFRIAWLFPHADLSRDPSNRLRRFQLHQYFETLPEIESEIFTLYEKEPLLKDKLLAFDIIVLFNVSEFDKHLCIYLKNKGKIVIFDHCENIFGLGAEDHIMEAVSAITCCSTVLAENTEGYLRRIHINKGLFVIRDPIDDDIERTLIRSKRSPDKNSHKALIMGMGANVRYVLPLLERACSQTGYKIKILTETGFDFPNHEVVVWSPYSWVISAMNCDLALCCHDKDSFAAKGNVKVTNPMAMGLPVIATSIESYKEAIHDGYNGKIVESPELWTKCLDELKDPQYRAIMGLRARQSVLSRYSTESIGLDYLSMINALMAGL